MANRNQDAGKKFERYVINKFNKLTLNQTELTNEEIRKIHDSSFHVMPKLGSTREFSRFLDSKKVDITVVNQDRRDEFEYLIQTKTLCGGAAKYPLYLSEIKEANKNGVPVFIHQQTKKANKRFVVQDEFACLYLEDFINMAMKIKELEFQLKQIEINSI
jgi:hypothetical protein